MANTSLFAAPCFFGMLRRMELRHLRYFVNVAEELSFTKAARKLHIAQPALSRQVRQLEEEVGVALLARDPRGISLTEAGQAFLAEARALLNQSEQAIRIAQKTGNAGHGPLNLGYVWGLFHSLAPSVIEQFRRQHPEIAVNLFDMTATEQAVALSEGRLDAGFIGLAFEADAAKLSKRKLGSCAFVAALPKSHPAARKARIALRDLAQDFFLVISEKNYPGAAQSVFEACSKAGFRPKVLQAAERGHTMLSLVAGNCGVALLPEPLRALPHPGVVFKPLVEPIVEDLFLAWNPTRSSTLRAIFLDALPKLAV